MAPKSGSNSYSGALLQLASDALRKVPMELQFFVLGICAYALVSGVFFDWAVLFHWITGTAPAKPRGKASKIKQRRPRIDPDTAPILSPSQDTARPVASSFDATVLQAVQKLLEDGCRRVVLTGKLCRLMSTAEEGVVRQALASVLEEFERSAARAELVATVRAVLNEFCLRTDLRLGELLLKACLDLRLCRDFDEVLAELEASRIAVPTVAGLLQRRSELFGKGLKQRSSSRGKRSDDILEQYDFGDDTETCYDEYETFLNEYYTIDNIVGEMAK